MPSALCSRSQLLPGSHFSVDTMQSFISFFEQQLTCHQTRFLLNSLYFIYPGKNHARFKQMIKWDHAISYFMLQPRLSHSLMTSLWMLCTLVLYVSYQISNALYKSRIPKHLWHQCVRKCLFSLFVFLFWCGYLDNLEMKIIFCSKW